jgi:hypothetical protein
MAAERVKKSVKEAYPFILRKKLFKNCRRVKVVPTEKRLPRYLLQRTIHPVGRMSRIFDTAFHTVLTPALSTLKICGQLRDGHNDKVWLRVEGVDTVKKNPLPRR